MNHILYTIVFLLQKATDISVQHRYRKYYQQYKQWHTSSGIIHCHPVEYVREQLLLLLSMFARANKRFAMLSASAPKDFVWLCMKNNM